MEEVTVKKVSRREGHEARDGSVAALVGEGDAIFGSSGNPARGHGPSSYVAGQIDEHAFAVVVTVLYADVPFLPAQFIGEVCPLTKRHPRRKRNDVFEDGIVHRREELSSEHFHHGLDGEKISLMTCLYPSA